MMLNACILLKVVPTKADAILGSVRQIGSVKKAFFTYGRFDIAVFAEANDYKELREATSRINSIEGVRSTETLAEA